MRTLQCHAGPILVRIGVALRLPGPISAGGGVRGSESGCNINLKKVLQGNAAGKCASQPLRATSAAQPKGCSGCSAPRAGTTSPKKCISSPKSTPFRDKLSKKCISSPKPAPLRDKLPPERLFLPKSNPNPGQIPRRNAFPPRNRPHSGTNSPQKGSFSQKSPKSGTNPALEPELLCIKKPACVT